jgi:hypothetical protein
MPAPSCAAFNYRRPPMVPCLSTDSCSARHCHCALAPSSHLASVPSRPRSATRWDQCKFRTGSPEFGVCTQEQRNASLSMAQQLYNGAATQLTPCQLYPFLRGRTLWLIG